MERHICIIPARAGSKSIKNKNLLKLNHKTLVALAVEVALESKVFDKIVISTDYPRHHLGIDHIERVSYTQLLYNTRPSELAQDDSKMADVVKHVSRNLGGSEKWIWVFQPTSPFRKVDDIKRIKTALESGEWNSAISFKPMKEPRERAYTVKNGVFYPLKYTNFENRQELKTTAIRSGNYYAANRKLFMEEGTFQIKPFFGFAMGNINMENCTQAEVEMSRRLGVNIDALEDYEFAKNIVRRGDFVI
jgi:CMP-N,N'-diacetyllegionaminic acid synthase